MKIIRYRIAGDITVEFQDKYRYTVNTTYNNFTKGIKNPYDRSIYGVGYLGVGKHLAHDSNGINTKIYDTWTNMLERCYNEKLRDKHPAYANCIVADEWHNFQTFADWYIASFYEVKNERMHLDKDILFKDNNFYSPYTCLIVPQRINMIFMKKPKTKDVDLPNTINRCVTGFSASYNGKSLGVFKTLKEAVFAHDYHQRIHILKVTEEYRDKIPKKVYNALINYNKEIDTMK